MNGHSKLNGNGTIDETSSMTATSIAQTKSDINSNTTIMDVNTTTTKSGFRLNGNRYAEHEEYSTGKPFCRKQLLQKEVKINIDTTRRGAAWRGAARQMCYLRFVCIFGVTLFVRRNVINRIIPSLEQINRY